MNIAYALKLQVINSILVPQYKELTADKMYVQIIVYVYNFIDYFSDYDESYISLMKYFWDNYQLLIKNLSKSLLIIQLRRETNKKITQKSKIEISF